MKKSTLLMATLLLITLSACGGKKESKSEQPKTSTQVVTTDTKAKTDATTTIETTNTIDVLPSSIEKETSTETSTTAETTPKDPQTIYNALMGEWRSTENDANGIQWSASFSGETASIAPMSGVGGAFSIKLAALNWDEQNQSLLITNEVYDAEGNHVPDNDFTLTVHDIDLENFSQMSVSGSFFGPSDLTYHRA
ncbi:hypothetical protein JZO66_08720 [Enterococcus sp. DIV0242_7C1]|uniref:Lipoprotein n=1 Tax=Candidatus Enterococcus dunnyi TaxID=1834192 RepID=A0A200J7C2_9ENTE|nr:MULTISPECIES: hypothetical protein [unclassified Enterococcus]MBO0470628.1 hypothetical protein [Enterococcus sp. DIV0242_7C1]OUZ33074.1 hypothetical protein A5889_001783 [Enterococcus sp. 9D6_DIV0238]